MKLKYLLASLFLGILLFASPAYAQSPDGSFTGCRYESTQSRVQQNLKNPWVKFLEIPLRRPLNGWTRFKVGSFHNGTGVFATDTLIRVTGPGIDRYAKNGETIWVNHEGQYSVLVTTIGQIGQTCRDTSFVYVRRPRGL